MSTPLSRGTVAIGSTVTVSGTVTVADGADTTQGAIADSGVVGDNTGTESAKLRGINKILADVWDSVNHWFKVSIQNTSLAVTQSGSWILSAGSALIGKVSIDQTTPGTTNAIAGDVPSGSADASNPVKIGIKAITALPTALAANQRGNVIGDTYGRPFVRHGAQGPAGGYTHSQHNPAANTKATITKASAGAGVRNVCTGLTVSLASTATAPTAVNLTVALIDGASGGTTYLWGPTAISLPAVAGATTAFVVGQCWKPGTAATGMTLEFSAAGGTSTVETVDFDSVTVAE